MHILQTHFTNEPGVQIESRANLGGIQITKSLFIHVTEHNKLHNKFFKTAVIYQILAAKPSL